MPTVTNQLNIEHQARIKTWFRIGGRADRLARPTTLDELRACLELDPDALILGDGANLLVDDDGVDRLVVDLRELNDTDIDTKTGRVRAAAGVRLPVLIGKTVNAGLGGIEGLAGIPASIGGAAVMNAGGRFGEFADTIAAVYTLDRDGNEHTLNRSDIAFGYRTSGLNDAIVTAVELQLTPGDPAQLKKRRDECMAHKTASQPLAAQSAGCCFKNPTLETDIADIGEAGARVSAGMLIDRTGCKGFAVGGAEVSQDHANFITTTKDTAARDVIDLMDEIAHRVFHEFGVHLEREVVVWSRSRR